MKTVGRVSHCCNTKDETFITTDDAERFEIESRFQKAQNKLIRYENEKKRKKNLEKAVLREFLKDDEVPCWYRELSEAQMVAADSLHASIRDDLEQGTVHRCCQNLLAIGLKPLVDRARVSQALKMCRSSDLVFLWVLMETFYEKTCSNCLHPIEKYTVNEQIILSAICHLDTVSTLRQLNKMIPSPTPNPKRSPPERTKILNLKCDSPYVTRLTKPMHHKKRLYSVPLSPKMNLSPYDKYLDDTHKVQNETTRWFNLSVDDEISDETKYKSSGSALNIVSDVINNQLLENPLLDSDRSDLPISICLKHKIEEEVRHAMECVYNDSTKSEISSYFKMHRKEKGIMRKVFAQMNFDQSAVKEQFTRLAQKNQLRTWLNLFVQDLARSVSDVRQFQFADKNAVFLDETSALKTDQKSCNESCNEFKREAFGHTNQHLPPFHNAYFKSGSRKLPHGFSYGKIFEIDQMLKSHMIENALKRTFGLNQAEMKEDPIDSLIVKCWKDVQQVPSNKIETTQVFGQPENRIPTFCRNNKQKNAMNDLLKEAVLKTKENNHSVLASIPDAHKLPILREWLRARCSHLYTKSECQKVLKKSILQFERLLTTNLKVKTPTALDIQPAKYASYGQHDSIYKKSRETIQRFSHEVRLALLRDSSLYWRMLKPYYCINSVPRDVFYAYMPASEYDTLVLRPWKKSEFVDAKYEFEKRQIARRKQNANQR